VGDIGAEFRREYASIGIGARWKRKGGAAKEDEWHQCWRHRIKDIARE
jgi:hypothetical protein